MIRRVENAMEWLLTFAESKAFDFIVVALVAVTLLYLLAQVVRWLS